MSPARPHTLHGGTGNGLRAVVSLVVAGVVRSVAGLGPALAQSLGIDGIGQIRPASALLPERAAATDLLDVPVAREVAPLIAEFRMAIDTQLVVLTKWEILRHGVVPELELTQWNHCLTALSTAIN